MDITIKDKTITLKRTFRSLIAYENAMNKTFNPTTISETIMFFYCVVISCDTTLELTFDEFIDWLDEHDTALSEFTQWLIKINEIDSTQTKKKTTRTKKNR